MSEDDKKCHAGEFVVGMWIGAAVMFVAMVVIMSQSFETHSEAIKHGAAHYDSQTGAFTWNNP